MDIVPQQRVKLGNQFLMDQVRRSHAIDLSVN